MYSEIDLSTASPHASELLIILSHCMYYAMLALHLEENETGSKAVGILVKQMGLELQDASLHL